MNNKNGVSKMREISGVDVLMLHHIVGKEENYIPAQKYWKDVYNLNVQKSLKRLSSNHLLEINYSLNDSLYALKVDELKEILRKNNLKVSGRKKELVNRIIDNVDIDNLKGSLSKVYTATPKGQKLIDDTNFINYTHRKLRNYLNPNEAYMTFLSNSSLSDKEVLIESLEKKIRSRQQQNINMLPYFLWEISKLQLEYDDFYEQFNYLIKAIVSNFIYYPQTMGNSEDYQLEYMMENFDYFKSRYEIPNVFIDDLKNILNASPEYKNELILLINKYSKTQKNIIHFSNEDIIEIILSFLRDKVYEAQNVYKKVFKEHGGINKPNQLSNLRKIEVGLEPNKQPIKAQGCGCLIPLITLLSIFFFFILL